MYNRSELLTQNTYWTSFLDAGVISLKEAERRALGTQRLKEMYAGDEWYKDRAKNNPDFWSLFYATRILS